MIKFRSAIIYIFTVLLAIMLFASFDAEFFFDYSSYFDISREMMYRAFTDNTRGLVTETDPVVIPPIVTEYVFGDENETVANYKRKLYYLGYLAEYPEDKLLDSAGVEAVRAYQSAKSLSVTGTLNPETRDALDSEAITYKVGVRGKTISDYKVHLRLLGYYPPEGELTDVYDEQMAEAVKAYQGNNSLEQNGELDVFTIFSMMAEITEQYTASGSLYTPETPEAPETQQ